MNLKYSPIKYFRPGPGSPIWTMVLILAMLILNLYLFNKTTIPQCILMKLTISIDKPNTANMVKALRIAYLIVLQYISAFKASKLIRCL